MSSRTRPKTVIVEPAAAPIHRAYGDEVHIYLGAAQNGGAFTMFTDFTPPGGGPPPHFHVGEDEWFFVLEGQPEFLLGDTWTAVAPGGMVYLPRHTPHTFRNAGSTPLKLLIHTSPAGFENFFRDSAAEFARPGAPDMKRLLEIAATQGVYFPTLSPADAARCGTPERPAAIVHPGQGRVLRAFGEEVTVLLDATQTGGAFTAFLETTPPGGGPPPHFHENEDEWFYVIEGRVGFFNGEAWQETGPGAAVFAPRQSVHTFKNLGDTPSRMLVHTSPSGFEKFFEEAAAEFARPGGPDMNQAVAIAAKHGIHFVQP